MRGLTHLPGAPDGQYLVLQFNTSFAEKKAAVETVTVGLEKDGGVAPPATTSSEVLSANYAN